MLLCIITLLQIKVAGNVNQNLLTCQSPDLENICFLYLVHAGGSEEDADLCRIVFQIPVLIMAELQVMLVITVRFSPGVL